MQKDIFQQNECKVCECVLGCCNIAMTNCIEGTSDCDTRVLNVPREPLAKTNGEMCNPARAKCEFGTVTCLMKILMDAKQGDKEGSHDHTKDSSKCVTMQRKCLKSKNVALSIRAIS